MRYWHFSERDEDKCRRIAEAVCGFTLDDDHTDLTVILLDEDFGPYPEWSGTAYYPSKKYPKGYKPKGLPTNTVYTVLVRFSPAKYDEWFPTYHQGGGHMRARTAAGRSSWPLKEIRNWMDMLVEGFAHEIMHIQQHKNWVAQGTPKVWGRFSEIEVENHAALCVTTIGPQFS